jgi:hypothetical protein
MGYEIDKIEKMAICDKETGEELCEIKPPITTLAEEITPDENSVRLTMGKRAEFSATLAIPPRPNILFIISPGNKEGLYATKVAFYRPKYYNWFQRLMYKMCFGITILQGENILNKI